MDFGLPIYFSSENGNIDKTMPSVDFWMDGTSTYNVIVDYSAMESPRISRIPVLIGGNIANQNFLSLYNIDLTNLSTDAKLQTGTDIITPNKNFTVSANKDGGNNLRLRIKFELTVNFGAHIFATVYAAGGRVM